MKKPSCGRFDAIMPVLPSSSSAHGGISYSGAVREISVVMGAFAGWRFFDEKMGSIRLIGSFVIFAGILMVALLG